MLHHRPTDKASRTESVSKCIRQFPLQLHMGCNQIKKRYCFWHFILLLGLDESNDFGRISRNNRIRGNIPRDHAPRSDNSVLTDLSVREDRSVRADRSTL